MRGRLVVLFGACVIAVACKAPPEPIVVGNNMITVANHTGTTWTNVEIWVNDHYRATKPSIAPGERVEVPLDILVAGFGQRFDPRRQAVKGVAVIGKQGEQPLKLIWGDGKRGI